MMKRPPFGLFLVTGAAVWLAGCPASSRQRPLDTSPVATGQQTIEAARKVLEGRWTFVGLDVSSQDGRRASIDASGSLAFDGFGNMNLEYRFSEPGLKALAGVGVNPPNPVISTSGQVAIDTQQRRITYVPPDAATRTFDPTLAAARANPFALERPRYYALAADGTLTLTTRHDDGRDAAVGRWRK